MNKSRAERVLLTFSPIRCCDQVFPLPDGQLPLSTWDGATALNHFSTRGSQSMFGPPRRHVSAHPFIDGTGQQVSKQRRAYKDLHTLDVLVLQPFSGEARRGLGVIIKDAWTVVRVW